MQWNSARETELSLHGTRGAAMAAINGAGVWVRGLASRLEDGELGVCRGLWRCRTCPSVKQRLLGVTRPHRCTLREKGSWEECRQGSFEGF